MLRTRLRAADALSTYGVTVGSEQPQRPESNAATCVVLRARAAPAPALMQCRVVAIDGAGGAGKSTLAARVAEGLDAQIICTDDFASWEEPLEWWPRLIEQVLDPLGRNQPGRYQRFVGDVPAGRMA